MDFLVVNGLGITKIVLFTGNLSTTLHVISQQVVNNGQCLCYCGKCWAIVRWCCEFSGHDRHDKVSHPMAAFPNVPRYAKDLAWVSARLQALDSDDQQA